MKQDNENNVVPQTTEVIKPTIEEVKKKELVSMLAGLILSHISKQAKQ